MHDDEIDLANMTEGCSVLEMTTKRSRCEKLNGRKEGAMLIFIFHCCVGGRGRNGTSFCRGVHRPATIVLLVSSMILLRSRSDHAAVRQIHSESIPNTNSVISIFLYVILTFIEDAY
ncbi:unnamed protein product [Amoebophrya sp. A25]|nr:unnamed protein product [Amoebophrya sp. A25]|eukprot:GSA25T00018786001.1